MGETVDLTGAILLLGVSICIGTFIGSAVAALVLVALARYMGIVVEDDEQR